MAKKRRGNDKYPPLTKPLDVNDKIIGPHSDSISAAMATLGHFGSNAPATFDRLNATINNPELKDTTKESAQRKLNTLNALQDSGRLTDHDLTAESAVALGRQEIEDARYQARLKSAHTGQYHNPEGYDWYFDHHHEGIDPRAHLSVDTQAALGSTLSPGTKPEDERASMHAIRSTFHPDANHSVRITAAGARAINEAAETEGLVQEGVHNVRDLTPKQLSHISSHASAERSAGVSTPSVHSTADLAGIGRVMQPNVEDALTVLSMSDPESFFDPATRPKTLNYMKNTRDSVPGRSPEHESPHAYDIDQFGKPRKREAMSAIELDNAGIAHQFTHGDPNQGMFLFSRETPDHDAQPRSQRTLKAFYKRTGRPAESYRGFSVLPPDRTPAPGAKDVTILSPERDAPMDQWMMGAMSGAEAYATRPLNTKTGTRNFVYSPAKRLVDDDMPGGLNNLTKESMGLPDDPRVTVEGVAHSWFNERSKEVARSFGAISHDQHGQPVELPASSVQAQWWMNFRNRAGENSQYNAALRELSKADTANTKQQARQQKQAGSRRENFSYKETVGGDTVTVPQMFAGGAVADDGSMTPFRTNPKAKPPKTPRK